MRMLDANMILRYLLNDNEKMADEAERIIRGGNVWVTIEVLAEEIYDVCENMFPKQFCMS